MPAHRIAASGSGLLPTMVAHDTGLRTKRYAQGGTPLSLAVQMLPTLTVHGNYNRTGASPHSGDGLATAIRMLPTLLTPRKNGGCRGLDGGARARAMLTALERKELCGGGLNPTWCEWFMGFPLGWTVFDASETLKYLTVLPWPGGR